MVLVLQYLAESLAYTQGAIRRIAGWGMSANRPQECNVETAVRRFLVDCANHKTDSRQPHQPLPVAALGDSVPRYCIHWANQEVHGEWSNPEVSSLRHAREIVDDLGYRWLRAHKPESKPDPLTAEKPSASSHTHVARTA